MNYDFFLWATAVVVFLAWADRLREVGIFSGWREKMFVFMGGGAFAEWFLNYKEVKNIWVFGIRIPLHPIFWNGYHFFKNACVLVILVFFTFQIGRLWPFLFWVGVWWVIQKIMGRALDNDSSN